MLREHLIKLIRETSPEVGRKAETLLKTEALSFVYEQNGELHALFSPRSKGESAIRTRVSFTDDAGKSVCSCRRHSGDWCEHAVAVVTRQLAFAGKRESRGGKAQSSPTFKGLVAADLSKCSTRRRPDARLELRFSRFPPHAPSKWEKVQLSVAMFADGKRYIGNPANLRQLAFGKGLGVKLDLERFESRDRQVVRFLALHAERDIKDVALKADAAAEFMHCLVGSENCFLSLESVNQQGGKWKKPSLPVDPLPFGTCRIRDKPRRRSGRGRQSRAVAFDRGWRHVVAFVRFDLRKRRLLGGNWA
ncbi:MAG: hypothetical protein GXP32_08090 [Kiritimatiellaeota bacterium]|nr:hypothetical protein [Kiritimatiellota bacterium]